MSYRIDAAAQETYLCVYRCHQCGEVVFLEGEIQGTASKTTMFRPSVEDHAQTRADAAADARANCRKLLYKVNNCQEFDMLTAWGQCGKCGATSLWKISEERSHPEKPFEVLSIISIAALGICCFAKLSGWLILASLVLLAGSVTAAVLLTQKAQNQFDGSNNQRIQAALRKNAQWNCFPHVMMKGEMPSPEQLLAILYQKDTTV